MAKAFLIPAWFLLFEIFLPSFVWCLPHLLWRHMLNIHFATYLIIFWFFYRVRTLVTLCFCDLQVAFMELWGWEVSYNIPVFYNIIYKISFISTHSKLILPNRLNFEFLKLNSLYSPPWHLSDKINFKKIQCQELKE